MDTDIGKLRMEDYLEQVYIPLKHRIYGRPLSPKSIDCCMDVVKQWQQLTEDPPVGAITQTVVDDFLTAINTTAKSNRRRGFSYATRRKMASHLRALLRPLEPRKYVPFGLDVLPSRIWVCVPPHQRKLPSGMLHVVDVAARIVAMMQAGSPSKKITGIQSDVWWQGFLGWLYFTGMRVSETLCTTWDMISGDVVTLPGEIRKHGVPHMMVLHPQLLEWLKLLKTKYRTSDRHVIPYAAIRSQLSMERQRTDIIRRLSRSHDRQVSNFGLPKTQQTCFHAYRKTHLTELALISDLAAQLSSSHGGNSLMTKHYLDAPRILRKAVHQLPVPPVDEMQKRLRERQGDDVGTWRGPRIDPVLLREIVDELKASTLAGMEG